MKFKKDEDAYFVSATHLYEMKSVQIGYKRGSRGVSVYGFRFGNYRGHAIKQNKLLKKSEGNLVMTDKNLYYLPNNGQRIVTIKINDIVAFNSDSEFIEIFKKNRQKAYYFHLELGSIKVIDVGLDFLVNSKH